MKVNNIYLLKVDRGNGSTDVSKDRQSRRTRPVSVCFYLVVSKTLIYHYEGLDDVGILLLL